MYAPRAPRAHPVPPPPPTTTTPSPSPETFRQRAPDGRGIYKCARPRPRIRRRTDRTAPTAAASVRVMLIILLRAPRDFHDFSGFAVTPSSRARQRHRRRDVYTNSGLSMRPPRKQQFLWHYSLAIKNRTIRESRVEIRYF